MKARLISNQGAFQLLVCNGQIYNFSEQEAREFITHFDDPKYYAEDGEWDNDIITMEAYSGETIAFVDLDGTLRVVNSERFRKLVNAATTKFLSVKEYAEKHGKKIQIVSRRCLEGRVEGAMLIGNSWIIPEDAPYPERKQTAI